MFSYKYIEKISQIWIVQYQNFKSILKLTMYSYLYALLQNDLLIYACMYVCMEASQFPSRSPEPCQSWHSIRFLYHHFFESNARTEFQIVCKLQSGSGHIRKRIGFRRKWYNFQRYSTWNIILKTKRIILSSRVFRISG